MPPNSFSKHSACRRCRSMKLRCPPREDNTLSCGRCLRLKVSCVSPLPKNSAETAPHTIPDLNGPGGCLNLQRQSPESMEPQRWPWQGLAECQSQNEGNVSTSLIDSTFQTPLLSSIGISECFTHFGNSEGHKSMFSNFEFCDSTHSEDIPLGVEMPADVFPTDPLVPDTADFEPTEPMAKTSFVAVDADPNLTGLRLKLSHRSHGLQLETTTRNLGSAYLPPDKDMNETRSAESSWFGDTLQDISKFLSIIEAHNQEAISTTNNHNDSTHIATMSIVIALDILAAYIQIVTIFNALCAQLCDDIRTSSRGSLSGLQTLPGLQLAGLSVEHGHLQVKILLQAVLHHFEIIEKVLGLPVAYRVSSRLDEYTGLFTNVEQYSSLMAIVIEDTSGKKIIHSLKQNLKRLAQLIYA